MMEICRFYFMIEPRTVLLVLKAVFYNPLNLRKPEASGFFIPVKSVNISI